MSFVPIIAKVGSIIARETYGNNVVLESAHGSLIRYGYGDDMPEFMIERADLDDVVAALTEVSTKIKERKP